MPHFSLGSGPKSVEKRTNAPMHGYFFVRFPKFPVMGGLIRNTELQVIQKAVYKVLTVVPFDAVIRPIVEQAQDLAEKCLCIDGDVAQVVECRFVDIWIVPCHHDHSLLADGIAAVLEVLNLVAVEPNNNDQLPVLESAVGLAVSVPRKPSELAESFVHYVNFPVDGVVCGFFEECLDTSLHS